MDNAQFIIHTCCSFQVNKLKININTLVITEKAWIVHNSNDRIIAHHTYVYMYESSSWFQNYFDCCSFWFSEEITPTLTFQTITESYRLKWSLIYSTINEFPMHFISHSDVFLCKRVLNVNGIKLRLTLQRITYLQKNNNKQTNLFLKPVLIPFLLTKSHLQKQQQQIADKSWTWYYNFREQGWRGGESTCLPMCPSSNVSQNRIESSWWSLWLVLYSASRGFSWGIPVFPSPQKPTFSNSNSIWIIVKHFIMRIWLRWLSKHSLCLTY